MDGTVTTLFPTLHAIGITGNNGIELLNLYRRGYGKLMEGEGFEAYIREGDKVKKGDRLVRFDRKKIEKAGFSPEVIVVVTNTESYAEVVQEKTGSVDKMSQILTITE